MSLNERVDNRVANLGWEDVSFNDDDGSHTVIRSARLKMMPMLEPRKLYERPIPALPEIETRFDKALTSNGPISLCQWNDFLKSDAFMNIPSNTHVTVEFQSEVLTTGFIRLEGHAGQGAQIKIICSESYEKPIKPPAPGSVGTPRWKGDRADFVNGKLYGPNDTFVTTEGHNTFEPLWFRTFRFVRLEISCSDHPLTLIRCNFGETHYPLATGTQINTSPEIQTMSKISLNTLRNCMHKTYEDCPYYEQNQFAMDTRIQILFTYQLSRDDRLARECMHEFYASRRDDGLLETHFPVPFRAINIPQFSLYWILMVYDHMEYFGDATLVRQYIGTVDGILDHFQSRITARGLVGHFDDEAWPFVDWVKEWHDPSKGLQGMGIPPSYRRGGGETTYNSLIYSTALSHAADLCDFINRSDTATEYRARAEAMNVAVKRHCYSTSTNVFLDGPTSSSTDIDVCQHTQVFAILANAITGRPASDLLRRTLVSSALPKCSYSMSFYVLRAASKTGLYSELFPRLIQPWQKMIKDNLTTWAEDDAMFRSDCHGWSASPIYEIVRELFGIKAGSVFECRKINKKEKG